MSKILDAYKNDFQEVAFSSVRKIIKFIGCLFIPFIYAFICIAAFWNPLGNIGKAPIAIVSLDQGHLEGADREYLVDNFMVDWHKGDLEQFGMKYDAENDVYSVKVTDTIELNNIVYISATANNITPGIAQFTDPSEYATYDGTKTDNKWSVLPSKYFMQIDIAPTFSDGALEFPINLDGAINNYIAYEKNYVSCEILDMGSQFIAGAILTQILGDAIPDMNKIIDRDVPNSTYAIYGAGIGELFLCVGMWVGGFSMMIMFDRKKRVKSLSSPKWYFSKTLWMYTVSILQSIIVMTAVGCLGFFGLKIGFLFEWLLVMFAGIVFTSIIQGLWFTFRDKSVATICMIIFLVLNIACGFGTFPAFMQFPIFHWLSYLMPFTYLMHAQGAIIFNIAVGANVLANSLYVLQMCGILLIYIALFFTLGIFMARKREREIYYGSCKKKDVLDTLTKLNIHKQYIDEKGKLVWKKLPKEPMEKVIALTMLNHPHDKKFAWFKKKEHYSETDLTRMGE